MDVSAVVPQLIPIVQHVLAGLLNSSGSGLFGKIREGAAIANYFADTAASYGENPLINGVVDAFIKGDAGQNISELAGETKDIGTVMNIVGGLDSLLSGAGEQGVEVKQFIYGLAETVASAAGEGLFGSGDRIGTGERQFLDALRGTLGL